MKKIETLVSDDKMKEIDSICEKNCYTRAEFSRRAIDTFLHCVRNNIEIVINPQEKFLNKYKTKQSNK